MFPPISRRHGMPPPPPTPSRESRVGGGACNVKYNNNKKSSGPQMQAVRHLLYKVGPMLFASSLNDLWWYNCMKMSQVPISLQIQLVVSTME